MILFEAAVMYAVEAAVEFVGNLLAAFLDSFIKWVATLPSILREVVHGQMIGAKTFVDTANNEEISNNYSLLSNGQWELTTLTRNVSRNDIPAEYLQQPAGKIDVTDQLEMTLR